MEKNLSFLSTRNGFNIALKHFKIVNAFIRELEQYANLADLINDSINTNTIKKYQFKSILNVILNDKLNYQNLSFNITSLTKKPLKEIANIVNEWNMFDFVIVYYHPQLGIVLINPKNEDSWDTVTGGMKENELIVIYVGCFGKEIDNDLALKAANSLKNLIEGKKVSNTEQFKTDSFAFPKVQKKTKPPQEVKPEKKEKETVPTGKMKLSPKYGVVVTNELFHNGNVEAWKKIIESYETKYPEIEVLVFYDDEQIHDINTLFKWGKVKHGTMIFFSLLGEEFKNISKLRRYLSQGASPRFEAFLKGSPGQILPLF